MAEISMNIEPLRDSYNTDPPYIQVNISDEMEVEINLSSEPRIITISADDFTELTQVFNSKRLRKQAKDQKDGTYDL